MSFNLQNVKFTWDDKFEGKELYASLFLNDLEEIVNRNDNLWKYKITKSDDKNYPFKSKNSQYFTFVYYEEEKFEEDEEERRMTKEALEICKKCREKQMKEYPQSVNCAFLNDNMYCERLEDINTLIEKLLERENEK